jgi:hypothetical protein
MFRSSTSHVLTQVSKLEQLPYKYKVKDVFCPTFYCELNCIEGLWCNQKAYVRRRTDQTYPTMLRLINESREHFQTQQIHLKLLRRFWRCLEAYRSDQTYALVLQMFFSSAYRGKSSSHTHISNNKLDD